MIGTAGRLAACWVLICCLAGCAGLAGDRHAYREAEWGMSVDEVKETETEAGELTPEADGVSELRYRLVLDEYDSVLSYGFLGGKLVYANIEYETDGGQAVFEDKKRKQLTERHSSPVEKMEEEWLSYFKWKDGDTVILLLRVSADRFVQVMYVENGFYEANRFAIDGFLDREG